MRRHQQRVVELQEHLGQLPAQVLLQGDRQAFHGQCAGQGAERERERPDQDPQRVPAGQGQARQEAVGGGGRRDDEGRRQAWASWPAGQEGPSGLHGGARTAGQARAPGYDRVDGRRWAPWAEGVQGQDGRARSQGQGRLRRCPGPPGLCRAPGPSRERRQNGPPWTLGTCGDEGQRWTCWEAWRGRAQRQEGPEGHLGQGGRVCPEDEVQPHGQCVVSRLPRSPPHELRAMGEGVYVGLALVQGQLPQRARYADADRLCQPRHVEEVRR
mmetsp:Transcript_18753/g.36480  ORF Transcript_18753/g.36480 Transcript_18753/m.36480 type:complete len:270 (+) Transcript_18753:393-1202(+)